MRPHFNQFPRQIQSNSSSAPLHQQVFSSNMPRQPQLGMLNSQSPFTLGNGQAMPMPNMQSPMLTQPGLMNAPNPFLFSQNNHLGMPQLGSMSQLGPQNGLLHNLSNVPMFPVHGQFLPQHLNQNMGFQNQMQNVNQFVPMQMPGAAFLGNSQFGPVQCNGFGPHLNQNRQNLVQPTTDVNGSKPSCTTQQLQGNSCSPLKSEPQLSQNMQFMGSQGNSVGNGKGNSNTSNRNWKNVPGKNFTRNPKRGPPQGFQRSQFRHVDNAKRKHGFRNDFKAKGHGNEMAMKFGQANHMNQPREMKRKSLALTYTEKEIQLWREERRKNYPTKANVEKKKSQKLLNSDDIDREAKMRCEQLKDILAKQAELGVEVAEIPSYYLFDSEKQARGREENTRPSNKRGRFQNKHDKKGRYNNKDQFAKKQKLADMGSSNTSAFNKRKPTLMQKLLSADIKRDRSQLLQVFRFVVMNSFFKYWPEKPLKFPLVVVKESGSAGEVIEDKSLLVEKDVSEHNSRITTDNFDYDDDDNRENQCKNIEAFDDNDVDKDEDDNQSDYHVKGKVSIPEENAGAEEEEGEIID